MQLGIYLDMRNPPGWSAPWADLYRDTIDLVVDAERRGADAVLADRAPWVRGWLPVAAARPRRGPGCPDQGDADRHGGAAGAVASPAARRGAGGARGRAVGRPLELGLGAGYVRSEFDAFEADEARRYHTTEACVRRLRALFAGGGLRPPPVQADLPIWLGYQGPRGARRAGALGVGLLSLDPELYPHYLRGRADAGLAGAGRVGGVVNLLLSRDPERALEQVLPAPCLPSQRLSPGHNRRPGALAAALARGR